MNSCKKVCLVLVSLLVMGEISAKKKEAEKADVYAPTDLSSKMSTIKSKTDAQKKINTTKKLKLTEKFDLAESSMFMYNYLGTAAELEEMAIFYDPTLKECGIRFDKDRRFVSFSRKSLMEIKEAFDDYEESFDKQTLSTKRSKTIAKYGKTTGRYYRKQFLKETNEETPTTLGYVFVKNAPYFVIRLKATEIEKNPVQPERNQKTPTITLLFNRNQLSKFLEVTSVDNVEAACDKALKELEEAREREVAEAEAKAKADEEAAAKRVEPAKIDVDLMRDLEKAEKAKTN
ncbi:MAG: hypothetical protein II921_08785 [Treponema sp.]|nr:hypothetical protein [Treponema sp.]